MVAVVVTPILLMLSMMATANPRFVSRPSVRPWPSSSSSLSYFLSTLASSGGGIGLNSLNMAVLGRFCLTDQDCEGVENSRCEREGNRNECRCKRHFYSFRNKECLPGQLLSFPCKLDAQCQGRVADSLCVQGRCSCRRGTVAFRRHTCTKGSSLGEICYSDEQCHLEDADTFCSFVLRGVFGKCRCLRGEDEDTGKCRKEFKVLGSPCHIRGPCSGIPNSLCVPKGIEEATCKCAPGFVQKGEEKCEKRKEANKVTATKTSDLKASFLISSSYSPSSVSLGYPCFSSSQCQMSDPRSVCESGRCECARNKRIKAGFVLSNNNLFPYSRKVRKARGPRWFCNDKSPRLCPKRTFQCISDGVCISPYFVCDGKADCNDSSDEDCRNRVVCPSGAFRCHLSDLCVGSSKVCNGQKDCPNGEDEYGCEGSQSCPSTAFSCSDGLRCLPAFEFCNAIASCRDGSDETSCNAAGNRKDQGIKSCPFFTCGNGRCRSFDVVCSGKDGCGDGSDEEDCQICRCPP